MDGAGLEQHIRFLIETDKLKSVLRRTRPIGLERQENSAEHSWQIVLMAILFADFASAPIDLLRVVKMLTIHDVVEVDVGDTFHYAKEADPTLAARELAAARRLFGLLPGSLGTELLALWEEFEAGETADSRYARAVDRLVAFFMNQGNGFGTWSEHSIPPDLVLEKNAHIALGSSALWKVAQGLVEEYRRSLDFRTPSPSAGGRGGRG